MICKKCGNQVADGEIFCQHCGIISDGVDYPGIKLDLEEALFDCVYYGPDYIEQKSADGDIPVFDPICFEPDDGEKDKKKSD